jgi:hypothetical protein
MSMLVNRSIGRIETYLLALRNGRRRILNVNLTAKVLLLLKLSHIGTPVPSHLKLHGVSATLLLLILGPFLVDS